jgi:hypothetical protein
MRSGQYPYLYHGLEVYTLYVHELYKQIHIEDGEAVTNIPWHFACGFLEEEHRNPMNWKQMAYNWMLKLSN